MSSKRVKMLQSAAGPNFSLRPGEIVEVDEAEAACWIAGGLAIDAPDFEVSAVQLHDLRNELQNITNERDGLAALKTDLEGKLAAALAKPAPEVAAL